MAGFPTSLIVVGNEKGGSGKSTVSLHLVSGLMSAGLRVGVIDLDFRQQTLTHFLANRPRWAEIEGLSLPMPRLVTPQPSTAENRAQAEAEDGTCFRAAVEALHDDCDVIVVDCPGADTPFGRAAHAMASTIVTPLNDSFVDFDVLASVDPVTFEAKAPSIYAEFVWESRKRQMVERRRTIDWLVVRNRMTAQETHNRKRLTHALTKLSQRIGFRLAPGLSERVIYRELFPKGLTVLDIIDGKSRGLTMAQIAARAEVRGLVSALRLPQLGRALAAG